MWVQLSFPAAAIWSDIWKHTVKKSLLLANNPDWPFVRNKSYHLSFDKENQIIHFQEDLIILFLKHPYMIVKLYCRILLKLVFLKQMPQVTIFTTKSGEMKIILLQICIIQQKNVFIIEVNSWKLVVVEIYIYSEKLFAFLQSFSISFLVNYLRSVFKLYKLGYSFKLFYSCLFIQANLVKESCLLAKSDDWIYITYLMNVFIMRVILLKGMYQYTLSL